MAGRFDGTTFIKKTNMKSKKKKRMTVIHTRVLEAVNTIPVKSDVQRDKMLHALHILYKASQVAGKYVEIPSTYWQKAIDEHYERTLNLMKKHGIIQSTRSYSNFEGNKFCKSYRINPKHLSEDVTTVEYETIISEVNYKRKDNSIVTKHTRRMMRLLKLNVRAAKTELNTYIQEGRFKEKIQIDYEIKDDRFVKADSTELPYFLDDKIEHVAWLVRQIANERGYSLIKDKNKFVIEKPELYYDLKKYHLRQSYGYSIAQFQYRSFYAKRNKTNNRLDSNLTSFPSLLLPHLRLKDESLYSIDLANSQFTILADLIEKDHFRNELNQIPKLEIPTTQKLMFSINSDSSYTFTRYVFQYINGSTQHHPVAALMSANSDVDINRKRSDYGVFSGSLHSLPSDLLHFIQLAKSGKIYEYIKDKLNLQNVRDAKLFAFEIFFAKYKSQGEGKRQLKKIFPTLIRLIDAYKKNNGNEQFAILLQQRESYIFIDRILLRLVNKGYKVFSKHDSILCIASELEDVVMEVRSILTEELGDYRLKITDASGAAVMRTDEIVPEILPVGKEATFYISMPPNDSCQLFYQQLNLWVEGLQAGRFNGIQ